MFSKSNITTKQGHGSLHNTAHPANSRETSPNVGWIRVCMQNQWYLWNAAV